MFDYVGQRKDIPELDEIDKLLEKSIKYRLVANVDIGLLLSGGIDSSLLACYMHELAGKKVKAFNVGFAEQSIDESTYAKQVASALGLELVSLNLEDISIDNFSKSIFRTYNDHSHGKAHRLPRPIKLLLHVRRLIWQSGRLG